MGMIAPKKSQNFSPLLMCSLVSVNFLLSNYKPPLNGEIKLAEIYGT